MSICLSFTLELGVASYEPGVLRTFTRIVEALGKSGTGLGLDLDALRRDSFAVRGAPVFMSPIHNADFIFDNNFTFKDRYSGESNYLSEEGELIEISGRPVWEGDFIRDVPTFKVPSFEQMGTEMRWSNFAMPRDAMEAHISDVTLGSYKKAHRHGGGAHILILEGEGYSLMCPGIGPKQRFDWHEGPVIVLPERWWHTHFILEVTPPFNQLCVGIEQSAALSDNVNIAWT